MIQAVAPLNIAIIAFVHVLELSSVTESCESTSVAAGRIQGALSFFTGDSLLCGLNRFTKDITLCNRVEIFLVPVGYVVAVN